LIRESPDPSSRFGKNLQEQFISVMPHPLRRCMLRPLVVWMGYHSIPKEIGKILRKMLTLLASMALGVVLACGVALAADISCPTGDDGLCVGTPDHDLLRGTPGRDKMLARSGNDTLFGNEQNDILRGNPGNDHLHGGEGNDDLDTFPRAGLGSDTLEGGPGNDFLSGANCRPGHFRDTLYGGGGNDRLGGGSYDRLYGEGGRDFITNGGCREGPPVAPVYMYGGASFDEFQAGNDTEIIFTGAGGSTSFTGIRDDVVTGGSGRDIVRVGEDNDKVSVRAADDSVFGGEGRDRLSGGDGNDVIYTTKSLGAGGDSDFDYVNCGRGRDTVYYEEGLDHVESNCEEQVPY
jgi:Ca2+-binding RTX toxin-like protein